MARKRIRATQYSKCGTMALSASRSPFGNKEIWWTLFIKSPVSGEWIEIQGGTDALWMTQLGFDPQSPT